MLAAKGPGPLGTVATSALRVGKYALSSKKAGTVWNDLDSESAFLFTSMENCLTFDILLNLSESQFSPRPLIVPSTDFSYHTALSCWGLNCTPTIYLDK
jgi:hypothetical protein